MRVIDQSKFHTESGGGGLVKNLQGMLSYGWSWQQSRRNQDDLIEILESILGSECVLIRDVEIPRVGRPIPLVLLTPSTLMVINPKSQPGFFRAEGKRWEELGRNDEYRQAPNNLIRETWLFQKTIEGYLKQHNFSAPMQRGVMIFVSPETVVESIRPRVRVIQADGIKNFARELSIAKPVFSDIDFRTAVNLLTNPRLPDKTKKKKTTTPIAPAPAPAASTPEPSTKPPTPARTPTAPPPSLEEIPVVPEALAKVDEGIDKVARRANFTRREWWIIGGLIIAVMIVLVILIVLVTFTL